jgi:iron complex outermembrane receptor protein
MLSGLRATCSRLGLLFSAGLFMAGAGLGPAFAQATDDAPDDTQPVEVVVTGYRVSASAGGTRIVTPLKDLPMSVQVVNETLIRDLGATRVEDAIRFVSGINKVNRNDSFGRAERFQIRGFNSGLILRNGVPYYALTDTANIAQIDVVKGSNSILYGFNDPGGLINYITRQPEDEAGYRLSQTFGSFDYVRTEADLTGPLGDRLRYRLIAAKTDADSWLENGYEDSYFLNPSLAIDLTSKTLLTLDYEHRVADARFQRDSYPFLVNGRLNTANLRDDTPGYANAGARYSNIFPSDVNRDLSTYFDARVTHDFTDALSLRLAYSNAEGKVDRYNMIGFLMEPNSPNLLRRRNLLEIGKRETDFLFADLSARFETPFMTHRVVVGAQQLRQSNRSLGVVGQFAPAVDIINPSPNPAVRYFRLETRDQLLAGRRVGKDPSTETSGFFITDQIALGDGRTNILIGARFDEVRAGVNSADNTTPQVGVNYALTPQISVYGLYSESFRLNAPFTPPLGGPTRFFPPEKGVNEEVGVKFDLLRGRLSGTLAVFELNRENVVQINAGNLNNPVVSLSGGERSRGVELDIAGQLTAAVKLTGSYAWMEANVLSNSNPGLNGAPLEGVSPNAASVFASADLGRLGPGRLAVNGGLLWRDGPIYLLNNSIASSNIIEDGYIAFDLGTDYLFTVDGVDLTASLKVINAGNQEYIDRRSAYAAPRRFLFTLRGEF